MTRSRFKWNFISLVRLVIVISLIRLSSLSMGMCSLRIFGARAFAQKINQKRDLVNHPEQAVWAGQINAMGLIDEIMHYVVGLYLRQQNPEVMAQALAWLEKRIGQPEVEHTLLQFTGEFPPVAVYQGDMTPEEYQNGITEGVPNQQVLLEEMMMLWLSNKNPATVSFEELFSDEHLATNSPYPRIMAELHRFFDQQPVFGPTSKTWWICCAARR